MNRKGSNYFWSNLFVVSSSLQRLLAVNVHEDIYLRLAILEHISMQVESKVFKFQSTWDKDSA